MDFNVNDLAGVFGASVALYTLLAAIFRQPMLTKIVNPHRALCAMIGVSAIIAAYGLIRLQAASGSLHDMLHVVEPLWTHERTMPQTFIAGLGLLNGLLAIGTAIYCKLRLPRDPSTFKRTTRDVYQTHKTVMQALWHYTNLSGGLEYAAVLVFAPNEQTPTIIDSFSFPELRKSSNSIGEPTRDRSHTRSFRDGWIHLFGEVHQQMLRWSDDSPKTKVGRLRKQRLDGQNGGFLFRYLFEPEHGNPFLVVVGVTLAMGEVTNHRFEEHFDMLATAIKNTEAEKEYLYQALMMAKK